MLDRPIATIVKSTEELALVTVALDLINQKQKNTPHTTCYGHIWLGLKIVFGFSYDIDI